VGTGFPQDRATKQVTENPFKFCEEAVRHHDPDRFFAALFAPADKRPHLFALTALYGELAHAAAAAREPMLRDIRLMWWRETVGLARKGKARDHAVARALADTLAVHDLPEAWFEAIISARAREALAGAATAEEHADATVGSLMRLWARVLGEDVEAQNAAIAYGLAGRVFNSFNATAVARKHFDAARSMRYSRAILPAVLPAALVPLYLKRPEPPQWRKQIALFGAARRGRL
jgi:phytoene/squalene synthetase